MRKILDLSLDLLHNVSFIVRVHLNKMIDHFDFIIYLILLYN